MPRTRRPLSPPAPPAHPLARVVGLVLLLAPALAGAATVHVPDDATTIAAALAVAQPGDTVLVACGTYRETDLAMPSGVVLRGETGDPACVVIDAAWSGPILSCEAADPATLVEGLTFTRGYTPGSGTVTCLGGAPVFRRCRFLENMSGGDGGAFYCRDAAPVLEECEFTGNIATGGSGGAVASRQSHPLLRDCVFRENRTAGWGGALYASGASPRLEKCELTGNEAYYGGGIATAGAALVLDRVTIAGNRATDSGGGTYLQFGASLDATDCAWGGNSARVGKDVLVAGGCEAVFRCCEVDPSTVEGGGLVSYDWQGCGTAAEVLGWGALKRRFR